MLAACLIAFVLGSLITGWVAGHIFKHRLKIDREQRHNLERVRWENFYNKLNHETMAPPSSALGLWELITMRLSLVVQGLWTMRSSKEWETIEQINELEGIIKVEFLMLKNSITDWINEKRKIMKDNENNQFYKDEH